MTRLSGRLTPDGHRITDREVRRGMRLSILAGAIGFIWFTVAMGYPLTMLLDCLGASGTLIGIVMMGIQLAMVVQVPASLWCERAPSRKPLWGWMTLAHRPLLLVPALIPFVLEPGNPWGPWIICVVIFVSLAMMHSVSPLWLSWMADLVPESVRGRFWSLRQTVMMIMSLIMMGVTGWILDIWPDPKQPGGSYLGFLILFGLAALMGTLDIIVHWRAVEPRPKAVAPSAKPLGRMLAPLKDTDFRWLTIALALWAFSCSFGGPFCNLYLKRVFAVSYKHLSVIAIVASLGGVLGSSIYGGVIDRIGARAFGVLMMVLAPLTAVIWFFIDAPLPWWMNPVIARAGLPQEVCLVVLCAFFAGMFYIGIPLMQMGLISALAPKEGKTMAMAVHMALVGVMASLGSLVAGMIVDAFPDPRTEWLMPTGARFGFIHMNLLIHMALPWFLGIPFLLKVRVRTGDLPLFTAMGRLLVPNPLRTMRNIYCTRAPVTVETRIKAVRDLGESRTAIALTDLIERLDDVDTDVREEAAFALGRIGSPEAVDALVAKLNDPNSDIKPHIARALRTAKDPRSVDALVDNLQESDRETQSETARTLGVLGDRRAVTSLLEVLKSSGDEKVVSASSTALSRLDEVAAIYEILPRMKETKNPVLKRSLVVAVADLLGTPDRFYKILGSELETHGSEMERMVKSIRKNMLAAAKTFLPESSEGLAQKLTELETAYEEKQIQRCTDLLLDLAIAIAALKHGVATGVDAHVLIEELIWKDERFGVGVWYLTVLREQWEEAGFADRDTVDLLLGVYFLYCVKIGRGQS